MLEQFQAYLVSKGYKEFSANGSASTAIDYPWRIAKIIEKENITLEQLSTDIGKYLELYGRDGEKWSIGKKSHESYYNALMQFKKWTLLKRVGA